MPISGHTVDRLRKLTALLCCPSCGQRSEQMESLTSCGHYLCANCVNTFVLNSDNKCPKCYAINRRNDCREDVFVNSVVKIGNKLNKLLDKESTDLSESKEESKQLVSKPREEPKKGKTQKEIVIESLKSCIARETKSKPKNSTSSATDRKNDEKLKEKKTKMTANQKSTSNEYDEDILSIPDSFDNELFTQSSKSAENTKNEDLVSVILEGLESNCDRLSLNTTEENGSGDQLKSKNDRIFAIPDKRSSEPNKDMKDTGVQTIEKPSRVILQNVSVQCTVSQSSQSVQTDKVVTPSDTSVVIDTPSSDSCQSNNCCFHKVIETISCNSLKAFLKSLIELKDIPSKTEHPLRDAIPSAPIVINSNQKTIPISVESKAQELPKFEEPMNSFDLILTNSSIDSVPPSIPSEVKTTENKKQNRPNARRQSTADKSTVKRQSSMLSKNNKKMKVIESSDEEMEVITEESKPLISKKPIVSKDIQIDSSVGTTRENGAIEESTSKSKPRIKGPKSRQRNEKPSEEPKTRPKVQKTYVSSDEEVSETKLIETNKLLTEDKKKNKSNRKTAQNKPQNKKTVEKPSVDDSTDDEMIIEEKQNKPRKQTVKRGAISGPKSSKKLIVEQLAEDLVKNSNTENIFRFTDDEKTEKKESNENKQRTKRKNVPKKRFAIESPNIDEKESEEKKTNPKKRQLIDSKDPDVSAANISNYKPKPKSKQKQVLPVKDSDVFKRPISPTPSVAGSETSSSSRHRTSSTERSKRVILFSGLDEKQKKKIESVCRELGAEAVNDFSDKVTHLVIALAEDRPKKDMICPRNAKYIKALLNNIWIVSYDWIVDSSRSDRFVDESSYEIKGDKTATDRDLPNISRTSGKKLFSKRMVMFEGKFGALLTEFKDFVEIGGGIVIQSDDEFDKRKTKSGTEKLIVVTEAVGLPNTQKDGTKYVSKKAFMDSISNFNPI